MIDIRCSFIDHLPVNFHEQKNPRRHKMPRISKTDYISNDNMQFFKIILNSASNKAKLGAIR